MLAVALLVGSAAAFTRTERLKLAASPVAKPLFERHLSPTCGCTHATSTLSLLLRRPERLDVSVVDSDGAHVATLADAQDSKAGRVSYEWNGRGDDGQIVPDGLYRLKVRLEHDRRTILIPKTILVDTMPPHLRILEAVTTDEGLAVRYRTNEGVRLHLLLDGKKVAHSAKRTAGIGRITWAPPGIVPTSGLDARRRRQVGQSVGTRAGLRGDPLGRPGGSRREEGQRRGRHAGDPPDERILEEAAVEEGLDDERGETAGERDAERLGSGATPRRSHARGPRGRRGMR